MNLETWDLAFPWPQLRWIGQHLGLRPTSSNGKPHNGSKSWADHLGLADYNDNSVKARRRTVMNVLTLWQAQRWYDAARREPRNVHKQEE